jgi:two-component system response regulator NreC
MTPLRIILADDFDVWRQFARSILEQIPGLRVIAEASNGLEAIEKAATLRPDVVLLDIAMPRLNGLEAAKTIRQVCPESKIVFLTQQNDDELRSAALATGAEAYLLKSKAAGELQLTLESVCDTRQSSAERRSRPPAGVSSL